MIIRCHKCKYKWDYKGKLKKVTCPNCGVKTDNKNLRNL